MLAGFEAIPSAVQRFSAGAVLIESGVPSERLLVLLTGRVEVVTREGVHILVDAPTVVGEVSFLGRLPAMADVRAVTDVNVREVTAVALAQWGACNPAAFADLVAWLTRLALSRVTGRFHERYCALVAHDSRKHDLIAFVGAHRRFFEQHPLLCTEHTGQRIQDELGLPVSRRVMSGPRGGDQEIGGLVSRGLVSAVFFFRDPLWAQPHQADVNALVRICEYADVPLATNVATARLIVQSLDVPEPPPAAGGDGRVCVTPRR